MSYEYARIPLKSGVNLICGPNGAGKSSILLGISVALGQSYTERSKKLSDLIRRGKNVGRVTIVLDNSARNGHRPVRRTQKDQIYLTRVIRKDGKYWFELDNTHATRAQVLRLLSKFEVDPDNMLIIMHQDMAEQFIVLSPQDKLKMVEEAIGLEPYRRNVLEARNKLNRIISEEESLGTMLQSAMQTLNYWREQYDRYQQKKQLFLKRRFLEREFAWAEIAIREKSIAELKKKINQKIQQRVTAEGKIEVAHTEIDQLSSKVKEAKNILRKLFEQRLLLEREKAGCEFHTAYVGKIIRGLKSRMEQSGKLGKQILNEFDIFKDSITGLNLESASSQISNIKDALENLTRWSDTPGFSVKQIETDIEISLKKMPKIDSSLFKVKNQTGEIDSNIESFTETILEKRVTVALLKYKKSELEEELGQMEQTLGNLETEIAAAVGSAEELGVRIVALRSVDTVLDEVRMVDSRITAMADITGEIERMYESYSKLYLELEEKVRVASENRKKTLEELNARMNAWKNVIRNLLGYVTVEYQKILSQAFAMGSIRLIDERDIEAAGIEILVGFKGGPQVPLDIYSQSGGERSTAIMAFLLALQQRIKSPFRAIDEYDVHMDPKNREVIEALLISAVERGESQYLAITPNQMYFEDKDIHIIMVQSIENTSLVREVNS